MQELDAEIQDIFPGKTRECSFLKSFKFLCNAMVLPDHMAVVLIHETRVTLAIKGRSRLLVPTITSIAPLGISQFCEITSQ